MVTVIVGVVIVLDVIRRNISGQWWERQVKT